MAVLLDWIVLVLVSFLHYSLGLELEVVREEGKVFLCKLICQWIWSFLFNSTGRLVIKERIVCLIIVEVKKYDKGMNLRPFGGTY
jgi:hypothetical protein